MCRLLTLVTAVSSMISKPVQPLTALEVMPNGLLADTDHSVHDLKPSSLMQGGVTAGRIQKTGKAEFRGRVKAEDVSEEDKAAFNDIVASTESRAIPIPAAFERVVTNPLEDARVHPPDPMSAAQTVQVEDQLDGAIDDVNQQLEDIAATNEETEQTTEKNEKTEELEVKVEGEYARASENANTRAFNEMGQQIEKLQQASQEQKEILGQDEGATANIMAGTREEAAQLAELERQVWEKNSDLSKVLKILTVKTNVLTQDLSGLYTAGFQKTRLINKLIQTFEDFVQEVGEQDKAGLQLIANIVNIMQDFAVYEENEKTAAAGGAAKA